jgi:hypothetical protein
MLCKPGATTGIRALKSKKPDVMRLVGTEGARGGKPARCQRTMVSGLTIASASQILGNNR